MAEKAIQREFTIKDEREIHEAIGRVTLDPVYSRSTSELVPYAQSVSV